MSRTCLLIGAPIDAGQRYPGCLMGPAAYRTAGIARAITALGHGVEDLGDVTLPDLPDVTCPNPAVHSLPEVLGWTAALRQAGAAAMMRGMPIFMGGDHSLSLGSIAGVAEHAHAAGRPLFVLWLERIRISTRQ